MAATTLYWGKGLSLTSMALKIGVFLKSVCGFYHVPISGLEVQIAGFSSAIEVQ